MKTQKKDISLPMFGSMPARLHSANFRWYALEWMFFFSIFNSAGCPTSVWRGITCIKSVVLRRPKVIV